MQHWYALHTKPRNEHMVRDFLKGRGIETYLPVLKVVNRRRREAHEHPFFTRYLFAHVDFGEVPISSVNWAPGVTSVISFGGRPAKVEDQVIQWLKDRMAQVDSKDYYQGQPLRPGDRLRVTAGPFKDVEAIFDQRLSSEDRARVFVDMLGRLTACEIALDCLQRA